MAHARHQTHQCTHAAHFFHLQQLRAQIIEIKDAFFDLFGHFGRIGHGNGFGGFFHQRDNVSHAKNSIGNPFGMKFFQPVHFFGCANKFNGFASGSAHGKGSPAASITIHTGENDAGNCHAFIKRAGQIYRVLPGQGINNQQNLMGIGCFFDLSGFGHQFFVNMGATGGIKNINIIAAAFGGIGSAIGYLQRCLICNNLQRIYFDLLPKNF